MSDFVDSVPATVLAGTVLGCPAKYFPRPRQRPKTMSTKNILTRSRKLKAEDLMNRGQLDEAQAVCAQVCQTDRSDVEAWTLLGLIERKRGRFAEAEQAARRAVMLRPAYAPGIQLLGTALHCQGRLSEAIACYRQALGLQPDVADTHYLLGNALRETGAFVDADRSYAKALELQPDHLQTLSNRGATLLNLGRIEEAAGCLTRANELQPGLPQVLCNIALLHQVQNNYELARSYSLDALRADENFLPAISVLADVCEKTSEFEKAHEWVTRGLAINPDEISLNMTAARIARHQRRTDDAIAILESIRGKANIEQQADVLMLLGELYDKKKDAPRAFACLSEGNRLKARSMLADASESDRYVQRTEELRQRFRTDHPETWQAFTADDSTADPIFLFGFPRSGTTLLEQILDSHPRLQAIPEKPTISSVEHALKNRPLSSLSPDDIRELRKVYFDAAARFVQCEPNRILVDKMPLNTVQAQLIWRLFPNAKCILAIRHPCDVCFSCFMQNFVINNAMSTFFTLEKTAAAYASVMSLWQEYIKILPIRYHRIRYEDLVADQPGETRRLLDFLELEWDETVLRQDEHARTRNINTPSYHQVTQPIYQDAKYRWKRYESYMQSVLPILQPYIDFFDYGEKV